MRKSAVTGGFREGSNHWVAPVRPAQKPTKDIKRESFYEVESLVIAKNKAASKLGSKSIQSSITTARNEDPDIVVIEKNVFFKSGLPNEKRILLFGDKQQT